MIIDFQYRASSLTYELGFSALALPDSQKIHPKFSFQYHFELSYANVFVYSNLAPLLAAMKQKYLHLIICCEDGFGSGIFPDLTDPDSQHWF
jgi:hypothetical protein